MQTSRFISSPGLDEPGLVGDDGGLGALVRVTLEKMGPIGVLMMASATMSSAAVSPFNMPRSNEAKDLESAQRQLVRRAWTVMGAPRREWRFQTVAHASQ